MKKKSAVQTATLDQNALLIKNSSWLKSVTKDSLIPSSTPIKTELKCSPMSEGSDQSMSMSSSEQPTSSEEDDDSEAETCPLLSEADSIKIAHTGSHNSASQKRHLTMNEIDENGYQYQNFDQMDSVSESKKWDKWNSDWCPASNDVWCANQGTFRQNSKSNGHDIQLLPNSEIKKTELSNNNQTAVNFSFDTGIWHDSAWSCPRRVTVKLPNSKSKTFENIVNLKPINTFPENFSSDALNFGHETKTHINNNSNGIRQPESNYVGTSEIFPVVNPFEKFFVDSKPANYNLSSPKQTKASLSPDVSVISSVNVLKNAKVIESAEIQENSSQNKLLQSCYPNNVSSYKTSSIKNMNSEMKTDVLHQEKRAYLNNSRIAKDYDAKDVVSQNTQQLSSRHQKEVVDHSESLNKRMFPDDVNLVTRSFNNFTLSSSKQKEILRLLQERRKSKETNISDSKNFTEETKILNIQNNPLRSTHIRRRLKMMADRQQIADGLVLEKVRYDPNWKRKNRTLCTSDEVLRHFGDPPKNNSNVPSSVPTETSTVTTVDDIKDPRVKDLERKTDDTNTLSLTKTYVSTECVESPTDNITPTDISIAKPQGLSSNGSLSSENCVLKVQSNGSAETTTTKSAKLSKQASELFGDFDVYNIETTMPTIDWAAMEAHLARAAKEDDWLTRRRNDREEIRKRLALSNEDEEDDYYYGERVSRKPSLSTRLQSGMNLQICFMNETASDQESPTEDSDTRCYSSETSNSLFSSSCSSRESSLESTQELLQANKYTSNNNGNSATTKNSQSTENSSSAQQSLEKTKHQRPSFFFAKQRSWRLRPRHTHEQQNIANEVTKDRQASPTEDFFTRQARLQAEARLALAQAKEMAKMQMEVEKQKKSKKSPIADIIGLPLPDNRHHLSKQLLSDMNLAQLQVIVNDLHTQIENLNEDLVHLLLKRDDLHMEQDSMLVDIEDLTRYLGAKEETQLAQHSSEKSGVCRNK